MEIKKIADFKSNEDAAGAFMVKSAAVKEDKNGRAYLDVTLGDKTGDISAKKWDISGDGSEFLEFCQSLKAGDIVKTQGKVTEWKGIKQYTVKQISRAPKDEYSMEDFVKAAPEPAESMYEFILSRAKDIEDSQLRELCVRIMQENKDHLMYYPAASKNHHAIMSGLLYHMKRMLMTGDRICDVYEILDKDLLATGVIVHDIEKIREIRSDRYGISDGYSFEGVMLGHITQGVREAAALMEELGISQEKKVMVEHMILSHHYEPEYGSPRKPMFPEAEILHYLDIMDARMYDMEDALATTEPGGFSENIRSLENRRVYKRKQEV